MRRRFSLFSLLLLNFYLFTLYANQEDFRHFNAILKAEILEMCKKDQEIRYQWLAARGTEAEAELLNKMIQIDDHQLIRLKQIIASYSWPGFALIDQEGSHAMWLLVQHTTDLEFQKNCLVLLDQAVADQDAAIIDLAYLKDRVLMYEGKKQIYGTQLQLLDYALIIYPIEDEEHVNERRHAIGLCSLEEYLEQARQAYSVSHPSY